VPDTNQGFFYMKPVFFKLVSFLVVGFMVATFSSYGNNDTSTKITATGIQIGSETDFVTTVKAYFVRNNVIAEAPFQNNGFTLQIPATVLPCLLSPVGNDSVRISVPHLMIIAYNENGNPIGTFSLLYSQGNFLNVGSVEEPILRTETFSWHQVWLYADRDAVIREGSRLAISTQTDDLNLRRGWNVVYFVSHTITVRGVSTDTRTYQNQSPKDMSFSWHFFPLSPQIHAKLRK